MGKQCVFPHAGKEVVKGRCGRVSMAADVFEECTDHTRLRSTTERQNCRCECCFQLQQYADLYARLWHMVAYSPWSIAMMPVYEEASVDRVIYSEACSDAIVFRTPRY